MSVYRCPICATALSLQASCKQYACVHQHHFDIAKEGYLNLLPVQHKSSLAPGDNKSMLSARRAFLEAGHYAKMADVVARLLLEHRPASQPLRILDLGCGEGYYSRMLASALSDKAMLELHGLDIAKLAVAAAAKKQPDGRFVVASAKRLPYCDAYFDVVLRVFAPSNPQEIVRVLKPNGQLLAVTPGPRHLWQLKEFIYPEVHEHPLDPILPEAFVGIATERIQYQIQPDPIERLALLQMTPFAWRATPDIQRAIQAPKILPIEVDFCVACIVILP